MHRVLRLRGIGLLELMLSIAVIGVILLAVTSFYGHVHGGQQLQATANMVDELVNAGEEWRWNYKRYQHTVLGDISLENLLKMGLLPKRYQDASHPFGGEVNVSARDRGHMEIQLTNVAKADCENLKERLSARLSVMCQGGAFVGIYPAPVMDKR